jgi:hypothetical protein
MSHISIITDDSWFDVCMYVCVYIYIYIHTYVHIYIYIYRWFTWRNKDSCLIYIYIYIYIYTRITPCTITDDLIALKCWWSNAWRWCAKSEQEIPVRVHDTGHNFLVVWCMHIYTYVCVCVCVSGSWGSSHGARHWPDVCVYMHAYQNVCVCVFTYIHMHACSIDSAWRWECIHMYREYTYACTCVYVYMYAYVCMYACSIVWTQSTVFEECKLST